MVSTLVISVFFIIRVLFQCLLVTRQSCSGSSHTRGKIGENIASCFEKLSEVKASELHSKLHRLSAIPIFVLSFLYGFSVLVFINRRHF